MTDLAIEALVASCGEDKSALARLITLVEDPRRGAFATRRTVFAALDQRGRTSGARVIGLTGPPGAGKSTLIGRLVSELLDPSERGACEPPIRVAILAVDPQSPVSGGSLLGDRTRVRLAPSPQVYFRSQPSGGGSGGIAPSTFHVCRLLSRCFDLVLVETVGIGQAEVAVGHVATTTYLVTPPNLGDRLQAMKAGVMEIADAFVVTKSDLPGSDDAVTALRSAAAGRPVFAVSALRGTGVAELASAMLAATPFGGVEARAPQFFRYWVELEHGRAGLARLDALTKDVAGYLAAQGGLDAAQAGFAAP